VVLSDGVPTRRGQDGGVLHVRLIVPTPLVDDVMRELTSTAGVVHVVHYACAVTRPSGELVACDVVREAANDLVESLQRRGLHHGGAITMEQVETVISDAAAAAESTTPGAGGDALVWEELEGRARDDAALTASFLVFMAVAAAIAAIGILLDSAILVIGAMVVGPDYGPLAAVCVGLVRRRWESARGAARTMAIGVTVAALAAFAVIALLRLVSVAPDAYVTERVLTSFISRPDAFAVVVAVLAGVVGMLSLTEGRAGALIGVLVSVTTIPAIGNIGAAAAYGQWHDAGGALVQLLVNVTALVVAGSITLVVQARQTTSRSLVAGRR
jgi:uncharacterized hydrophobic protein (TIGR00271 family)